MTASIRRLIADARIHAPGELAELPRLASSFALCLLALAFAWVALP